MDDTALLNTCRTGVKRPRVAGQIEVLVQEQQGRLHGLSFQLLVSVPCVLCEASWFDYHQYISGDYTFCDIVNTFNVCGSIRPLRTMLQVFKHLDV